MRVVVAGSTGVVGRHVVAVAQQRGHEVVGLSRGQGVDLLTGDGLASRLEGADAVVDVTSTRTQRKSAAEKFFGQVTTNLLAAEQQVGVSHHLALSIVGIDDVPLGYYQGKLCQERVLAGGDVPWTVLRSTQFHEFSEQSLRFAALGPLSLVPRTLCQPVAATEVAAHLIDLAEAGPGGRTPDLAGPERLQLVDMARRVVQAKGLKRRVLAISAPGAAAKAARDGALCPTTDGPRGRQTFAEWLSAV